MKPEIKSIYNLAEILHQKKYWGLFPNIQEEFGIDVKQICKDNNWVLLIPDDEGGGLFTFGAIECDIKSGFNLDKEIFRTKILYNKEKKIFESIPDSHYNYNFILRFLEDENCFELKKNLNYPLLYDCVSFHLFDEENYYFTNGYIIDMNEKDDYKIKGEIDELKKKLEEINHERFLLNSKEQTVKDHIKRIVENYIDQHVKEKIKPGNLIRYKGASGTYYIKVTSYSPGYSYRDDFERIDFLINGKILRVYDDNDVKIEATGSKAICVVDMCNVDIITEEEWNDVVNKYMDTFKLN